MILFAFAIVIFVGFVAVVVHVVRHSSENYVSMIHRQANCPHPYHYWSAGKRLCAKCGKEWPKERWQGKLDG
jgi:hypothetical protein